MQSECNNNNNNNNSSSISAAYYTLRVKLIKAVDLPANLTPNTPTCPRFKLGLLPLHGRESIEDLQKLLHHGGPHSPEDQAPITSEKHAAAADLSYNSLTDFRTHVPLTAFANSIDIRTSAHTDADIKVSSSKILAKEHFGAMDWHEEFVWEGILSPHESVLAVELATLLLPPTRTPLNARASSSSSVQKLTSSMTNLLWGNNNSTSNTNHSNQLRKSSVLPRSVSHHRVNAPMANQDTAQTIHKHTFLDKKSLTIPDTDSKASQNVLEKDLRIGTLLIPLSRLPAQDDHDTVDETNTTFVVEKWYQLQSHGSLVAAASRGKVGVNLLPSVLLAMTLIKRLPVGDDSSRISAIETPRNHPTIDWEDTALPPLNNNNTTTTPVMPTHRSLASEDSLSSHGSTALRQRLDSVEKLKAGDSTLPTDLVLLRYDSAAKPRLDEFTAVSYRKRTSSVGLLSPTFTEREDSFYPLSLDTVNTALVEEPDDEDNTEEKEEEEDALDIEKNGPLLSPGIVDHLLVVGVKNIVGALPTSNVDLGKGCGWLEHVQPECCILEQYPPVDVYNRVDDKIKDVPTMAEWFCFPMGCKVWRGDGPPSHADLKRIAVPSSQIPPSTSISNSSEFNLSLDFPATFYWWVTCSNAIENGFQSVKTYGAVVCFYVPTPWGIDTQKGISMSDDGHKTIATTYNLSKNALRIWTPIGICVTSTLPIIGVLEEILLRICKGLALSSVDQDTASFSLLHKDILDLILRYPEPIPSLINVSLPFLYREGNRILVTVPPLNSLPPLPHGGSVTRLCQLLGGEGLTILLAAMLTECKILITSSDIANLAMVAEVACALIYPFRWQLPYVPVLPLNMIEFLDAPLSFFLGVPSSNMKYVDRAILREVVVIDLDEGTSTRSSDTIDQRRWTTSSFKMPLPFPTKVHNQLVDAVNTLVRVENELLQEQYGSRTFPQPNRSPRLECESAAEREFRIKISCLISSMLQGYQENISFVSATKPVFNHDRFLKKAPFLLEESEVNSLSSNIKISTGLPNSSQSIVNSKTKTFLTCLVNTQLFHGLIDNLDDDDALFFHDIMENLEKATPDQKLNRLGSFAVKNLIDTLERREHEVPSYIIKRDSALERKPSQHEYVDLPFTHRILLPNSDSATGISNVTNVQRLDILEQHPWAYKTLFGNTETRKGKRLVSLKEALGEEKFIDWKKRRHYQDSVNADATGPSSTTSEPLGDFQSLSINGYNDAKDSINFSLDSVNNSDTEDVKAVRQCLEAVFFGLRTKVNEIKARSIADIIGDAENALDSPSARSFLLSILSKNDHLEAHDQSSMNQAETSGSTSISIRLVSFRCLLRLCVASVEYCRRDNDFISAYKLLARASCYRTLLPNNGPSNTSNNSFLNMAKELSTYPIFSDFRLWEAVYSAQKKDKQSNHPSKPLHGVDTDVGSYDASVSTLYEMISYGLPFEFVLRFASHMSQHIFSGSAKGHQLLLYVKRIANNGDDSSLIDTKSTDSNPKKTSNVQLIEESNSELLWDEIAWYHPSCLDPTIIGENDKSPYRPLAASSATPLSPQARDRQISYETLDDPLNADGYVGRIPVTCLTSFGSSVVVSGAIDGSVFFRFSNSKNEFNSKISGIRMECPSRGPDPPSISCLGLVRNPMRQNDKNIMSACSGHYAVAGTSQGDLSIWSLKGVYQRYRLEFTNDIRGDDLNAPSLYEGVSFPSGHRNGVTCIDVPSSLYRPYAFITGGGGGLINLWAFRPEDVETAYQAVNAAPSRPSASTQKKKQESFSIRPKITMTGNMAKIFSLKTAWHTDLLLSGSSDGTIRLWDVGEKFTCINSGKCHTGFVTHLHYWDGSTVISGSTDRTISIWDSRMGPYPYVRLMYHKAPISDIVVGSRKDYSLVTAGCDGVIACWDLRYLSAPKDPSSFSHQVLSKPNFVMRHGLSGKNSLTCSESLYLASGLNCERRQQQFSSVVSVGVDGSVNEWDLHNCGKKLAKDRLFHSDAVSVFRSFTEYDNLIQGESLGGYISSSWDGSIRLRSLRTDM